MTTPYRKPFSKKMYQLFDGVVKKALIQYLESQGHRILDATESYGADVISEKDGIRFYSEGEMKSSWKREWPRSWKEIRIPERKKKLLDKYENIDFYIFNESLKRCWKINSSLMTEERCKEAFGRNITMGEHFFHIPYEEAQLIILEDDDDL